LRGNSKSHGGKTADLVVFAPSAHLQSAIQRGARWHPLPDAEIGDVGISLRPLGKTVEDRSVDRMRRPCAKLIFRIIRARRWRPCCPLPGQRHAHWQLSKLWPLRHPRKGPTSTLRLNSRPYSPSFALIRMCQFRHDLNSLCKQRWSIRIGNGGADEDRSRCRAIASSQRMKRARGKQMRGRDFAAGFGTVKLEPAGLTTKEDDMEAIVSNLVSRFEKGLLSRRELVAKEGEPPRTRREGG
jgi:hypothetical protein